MYLSAFYVKCFCHRGRHKKACAFHFHKSPATVYWMNLIANSDRMKCIFSGLVTFTVCVATRKWGTQSNSLHIINSDQFSAIVIALITCCLIVAQIPQTNSLKWFNLARKLAVDLITTCSDHISSQLSRMIRLRWWYLITISDGNTHSAPMSVSICISIKYLRNKTNLFSCSSDLLGPRKHFSAKLQCTASKGHITSI